MKIGIYDPYLDTLSGGEKYMLTAATCLSRDHDVSIFWEPAEEKNIKQSVLKKFDIDLSTVSFRENIFTKYIDTVTRLRKTTHYDYIMVLSDGSIPLIACRMILHFQSPTEWVKPNRLKTALKLLHAKAVLCNSAYTKKYIDRKFHINSSVLYPPIVIRQPGIPEKENIIVSAGRYGNYEAGTSYKKQEVLLDAFMGIEEHKREGWKLVLIVSGNDVQLRPLQKLKQKAQGQPVEFVVNADNNTFWQLCDTAKIYWHAAGYGEDLEKYPDRAEHFGMSTVEAMSRGAVPIVISAGGQKEIVEEGVSGFLWESLEQLQSISIDIMHDEKKRKAIADEAVKRASFFSSATFCKQLNTYFS